MLFKIDLAVVFISTAMAPRRMRKVSQDLDGQPDGQQSYDQKIKLRKELFIQQFEKEGQ